MKINYSGYTHRGNAKPNNEDNFFLNGYIKEEKRGMLLLSGKCQGEAVFAVCDGIGGEAAGEKAAFLSVSYLKRAVYEEKLKLTGAYINEMNTWLCKQQNRLKISKMGSTLVLVKLYGNKMEFANLGDSRLYLMRKNRLIRLSEDHTEYEYLRQFRALPKNPAALEHSKHTLLQHLGVDSEEMMLEPQTGKMELWTGDKLLLCSDGISDMLEEERIQSILQSHASTERACISLVDRAMECGKTDNLTAVVLSVR